MFKQLNLSRLLAAMAACVLSVSVSNAHADIVDVDVNWNSRGAPSGTNPNTGGLSAASQIANGSDELNLAFTIDDSADTGAIFTGVLTLSGTTNAGANEVSTNGARRVVFVEATDTRQSTLDISLSSLVETTSTGATINFDGFTNFTLDQFNLANDTFTFDGQTYAGDVLGAAGGAGVQTIDFLTTATSGTIANDLTTAGQFRFEGLGLRFTVGTAVPEPGSASVLALGLLGFAGIRRRRK